MNLIEIIGVYRVPENSDASLVEVVINKDWDQFDIGDFIQEIPAAPKDNWQAPFNEKFLDEDGMNIIGDEMRMPTHKTGKTRLTFFIYFLDVDKLLNTPLGKMQLPIKTQQPDRISSVMQFEDPE